MSDRVCATCGHCDPDTNECWFDERSMSDAEARTRTCKSWEPKKEVPLQPDGSVKMQSKETIGATIANPESVTRVSLGRLGEKQPDDKRDPFEIPKEAMKTLQYSESDMQELRGRTLEALDMMTDIALQQMPGSKKRWLTLRTACIQALRNHWKHHDEAIKPYREEAKSHE